MFRFYARRCIVVDKVNEIISFRQSKWLEKIINFNTQKTNLAKNDFEKYFYKLLNNAFSGKTMECVRSRIKVEYSGKDDNEKNFKQEKNNFSMEYINLTQITTAIRSNKRKYLRASQFI